MAKLVYGMLFLMSICLVGYATAPVSKKCYILRSGEPYSSDSTYFKILASGECIQLSPVFMHCFPSEIHLDSDSFTHTTVWNKKGEIIFDTYTMDTTWFCRKDSACPIEPGTYYYQIETSSDSTTRRNSSIRGYLQVIEK